MAYEIISQNNNTTTLSDGTNTITVPSRVVLATGTTYEITEVNNSTATLEGSDGSVIRDVPCVAVLAGGGGSSLPDQTGHSGEFLTTDGTDASWAAVDALPSQTGQSGKFLTTDGSAASWSNKPLINDTNQTAAVAVGEQNYYQASAGYFGTAVGGSADAAGNYSIAYGYNARATAERSIQIGPGTNNDIGSLKVATMDSSNNMANYTLLDRDGAIPTDRFTTTPSADGTYVPTLTISSGTPTRSWTAPSGGLPSQTGNSGKFLTTDGTDASWDTTIQNRLNITLNSGNAEFMRFTNQNNVVMQLHQFSSGSTPQFGFYWKSSSSQQRAVVFHGTNVYSNQNDVTLGKDTNKWGNVYTTKINNGADITVPNVAGELAVKQVNTTITLTVADWSSNTQTVSVTGMTATAVVLVAPDSTSQSDYTSAGILCTAQGAGTLTFTATTTPTNAITVNVVAL